MHKKKEEGTSILFSHTQHNTINFIVIDMMIIYTIPFLYQKIPPTMKQYETKQERKL